MCEIPPVSEITELQSFLSHWQPFSVVETIPLYTLNIKWLEKLFKILTPEILFLGAREMALWLRANAGVPEALCLVPGTRVMVRNHHEPQFQGVQCHHMHTYIQTKHTCKSKKCLIFCVNVQAHMCLWRSEEHSCKYFVHYMLQESNLFYQVYRAHGFTFWAVLLVQ